MIRLRIACLATLLSSTTLFADAKKPNYTDDVLPIFKQHCTNCHGNDKQSGDLNVATYAQLQLGGSSGVVAKPGDPDKSRIFTLTAHKEKPEMPPKANKIADAQIEIIRLWIEQGMREKSDSKVSIVEKPKIDIGLTSVGKGKPEGPPPMPMLGKLKAEPLVKARRPGAVLAMAASPWAPLLAVGGQRQIILFNTESGDFIGCLPFEHGQINSLKFSRNGKMLLAAGGRGGQSGKAVLYNIEKCEKVTEVGIESDALLAADISPDQKFIAVGSPSKLVRIYNTADGAVLHEIKKHTDWVTAVEFSPDGVLLATGDRGGGVFAWESNTGREFHALRGHTGNITDISWRGDSNLVASSSEDGSVRLWEMNNGTAAKTWTAHAGGTASVRYSHDGKLATTGRDKTTKVWDGNGTLVKQFAESFTDLGLKVSFTTDNNRVVAGDWTGSLRTWNVADGKLLYSNNTNPLAPAEQLKLLETEQAALEAQQKQAQAAYTAVEVKSQAAAANLVAVRQKLNKINAEMNAAQKYVTDYATTLQTLKTSASTAKADFDKVTATVTQLKATETQKQAAYDLAKKDLDRISELFKKATASKAEYDKAVAAEKTAMAALTTAKAAVTAQAAPLKAATDKHTLAAKALADAPAKLEESKKAVVALQPQVAPATAAIVPVKAVADQAAAAMVPVRAEVDKINAQLTLTKAEVERYKKLANVNK